MKHQKTIYYISDNNGNDGNEGVTAEKPIRSLLAVAQKEIYPGDEIRLEKGSVFTGQYLHLKNIRGTREEPVLIGSYGEGEKPLIETRGNGIWYQNYGTPLDSPAHTWRGYVSSGIHLADCEYVKIDGIEITNNPDIDGEKKNQGDRMNRTGVSVIAREHGTLRGLELSDLYIHDVEGNIYDKHLNNGGIYITALKPEDENKTGIARYDGIHIHHCKIENVRRWGIAVGYTYHHQQFAALELPDETVQKYGSVNVLIEHNKLAHVGGDGITVMYCYRPLIQYNRSDYMAEDIKPQIYTETGERGGMVAAAIWPWKCKDAVFQYNEAYHTGFNQDGEAWDCDSGDGTIYQYNYSYGNGGGCVMFCEEESIHNIFRFNVSEADETGTITPVRNADAHIHDNVFFVPEGTPFIRQGMSGGGMLVENNHIIYQGKTAREEDWYHQTEQAVYYKNLYCNYLNAPEQDSEAQIMSKEDYDATGQLSKKKEEIKYEEESCQPVFGVNNDSSRTCGMRQWSTGGRSTGSGDIKGGNC